MIIDEGYKRYATERQAEFIDAVNLHGSKRSAAEALGLHHSTLCDAIKSVIRKASQQGYMPPKIDLAIPEGMTSRGPSILEDADGRVLQVWNKMKSAGMDPADAIQLPGPKHIKRMATLRDSQGNVTQQWVTEEPDAKDKESLWKGFSDGLKGELTRYEPVAFAGHSAARDLLACYPVGDHHLGMLAWGKETGGESYDLKISEKLISDAANYLIDSAPSCEQALIPFLGDFLHYDSFDAVTPTGHNLLDADGRYPKMVRSGVRAMRTVIDAALRRHLKVSVIVEIGNHDLSSSVFLMECLAIAYENEPRVTIDTSPSHYHYFEFGNNLIGTHHGHGTKMDNLPLIMASDRREAWGRTAHRYWWTGHIHTRKKKDFTAQDFSGCSVESFRILAPLDAWAAQKGYRSIRDMKSIVLHREFGEVMRHTVSPTMLK